MTSRRSAGELEKNLSHVTGSNTSGSDSSSDDDDPMSVEEQIGYVVLMSACIGVTVIGNILVILSVFTYRPLRNVQNFYIVSLACADLAVALIVMPFNVVTFVLEGRWVFGEVFCNIWLTCDILTCTASILNLCGIAVDRYCAIHDPIAYSQRRTVSRVMVNLAVIWTVSAVISIPPLIGWNNRAGESLYDDERQICQLTDDRGFVIYSASGSFYIPLCLMTFVYVKIFLATRARLRARAKAAGTLSLTPQTGIAGSTYGSDQTDWNHELSVVGRQNGCQDSSKEGEGVDDSGQSARGLRLGEFDDDFPCDAGEWVGEANGIRTQNENTTGEKVTNSESLPKCEEGVTLSNGLVSSPNGRQANDLLESPWLRQSDVETTNCVSKGVALPSENPSTKEAHLRVQVPRKQHPLSPPSKSFQHESVQTCPLQIRTNKNQNVRIPTSSKKQFLETKLSTNSTGNHFRDRSIKHKRTLSDRLEWAVNPPESSPKTEASWYRKRKRDSSRNLKISLKSRFDRGAKPVDRSLSDALARSSSQYLTVPRSPAAAAADPSPLLTRSKPSLRQTKSNDDDVGRFKFSLMLSKRISRDNRKSGIDGSQRKDFWSEKQRISLAKERRVARTMAIIMAAFVVCWLPFFLMYVIFPFCDVCVERVDQRLVNFIVWLGYVNSTLNPIIYTIFNIDFRRAFVALLRGKRCSKTSTTCSITTKRR